MKNTICLSILFVVMALFLLLPDATCAKGKTGFRDLPLPVRLVLSKIGPMMKRNDYPRAIKTLRKFIDRGGPATDPGKPDPKGYHHPEIWFALGNCHLLLEDYKSAARAYRRTVARDPAHTFGWLNLAKAAYETGQYAEAGRGFVKGYETAEKKTPEHLYYGAAAFTVGEKHERAIEIFERLAASHPQKFKPEWKEQFVHALLTADRPKRALPIIRELARIYSGDKKKQWREILLYQYMQLDMHAKALKLARELTLETPDESKWWKAMAHIQLNSGRYEEALAALTVYAFLTPLTDDEKKLLADLNFQAGIPVKAVPLYEDCLKAKPERQLLTRMVHAYRQLGKPETALAGLEAFQKKSKDAELMLLKGDLLYDLKRYGEAAKAFRHAAKNGSGEKGRAWLMAGYAAMRMNDFGNSRTAFKKAAGYKRHKKAAAQALRNLDLNTAR